MDDNNNGIYIVNSQYITLNLVLKFVSMYTACMNKCFCNCVEGKTEETFW